MTPENSISQAMVFLVVLLIFRLVLRRDWIAFLGFLVLTSLVEITAPRPEDFPVWAVILQVLAFNMIPATMILCLLRFGLVSVIGGIMMMATMGESVLTWEFQSWYAGSSLMVMVAVLALASWAFSTALAGRSVFKGSVLD